MKHCISILNPIVKEVKARVEQKVPLLEIKQYVVQEVDKHYRMDPVDRRNIINKVSSMRSTLSLLEYLYSSLLKFEGLGVI